MIETWVLIMFFHVGAMGDGNSNATAVVPNFISQQECQMAGAQAKSLVSNTVKQMSYTCVKQTQKGK